MITLLLADRYLYLKNEENLKPFIVLGKKKFSDKQGFLVSMERYIVFYKKTSQMSWFLFECGLPFATPADSIHYLLCMRLFKSRSYSRAKFKLIPVWKKTYRNSRSYTKYLHSIFVYKARYLLVSGFCRG